MDICKVGKNKAKVTLSAEDMEYIGITFEDINCSNLMTEIFIGSLIKLTHEIGILGNISEDIEVDLIQTAHNEIIVYLACVTELSENTWAAYYFDNCRELTHFCLNIPEKYKNTITADLLFNYLNIYILLINYSENIKDISPELIDTAITDNVIICKIKEYAKLISRTPIKSIYALTDCL